MSLFTRFFGGGGHEETPDEPFLEHPTGEFETALEAIQSAMTRLDAIDMAGSWITFSGQGQGHRPDSYYVVDVEYMDRKFNIGPEPVDLARLLKVSGLDRADLEVHATPDGVIEMSDADARQRAIFLDALFQQRGVKPFDGEDDYAVGAEWSGESEYQSLHRTWPYGPRR